MLCKQFDNQIINKFSKRIYIHEQLKMLFINPEKDGLRILVESVGGWLKLFGTYEFNA